MLRALCACLVMAAFWGSPAAAGIDPAGPGSRVEITQLLLDKSSRTLYLLQGTKAVRSYSVDLGPDPAGPKPLYLKPPDARPPAAVPAPHEPDRRVNLHPPRTADNSAG